MYKAKPFTLINEHWKKQFLSQDNVGKFSISCGKFKKKKVKVKIYCILAFKEFKRWKTNPERRAKVIKKHDEDYKKYIYDDDILMNTNINTTIQFRYFLIKANYYTIKKEVNWVVNWKWEKVKNIKLSQIKMSTLTKKHTFGGQHGLCDANFKFN